MKKYFLKKNGIVAIIGRTNSGKSSLINRLVKKKVSIITKKNNTTRCNIISKINTNGNKIIFIDTPGPILYKKYKNINNYIHDAIYKCDIILFMTEIYKINKEDIYLIKIIKNIKKPTILIVNKIDKEKNKIKLLPYIKNLFLKTNLSKIIPISILKNIEINTLKKNIIDLLSYKTHKINTKSNVIFKIKEIFREKLLINLNNEIPYILKIYIESIKYLKDIIIIKSSILVKKKSQKAIIIGKNGKMLKLIGTKIRLELKKLLKKKICVKITIK